MSTLSIDNQAFTGEFQRVVFNLPSSREVAAASVPGLEELPKSYWTFDESKSEAVLMTTENSELERQRVVTKRIQATLEALTATGGEVIETYECVLPDGRKVIFYKTVHAIKSVVYTMNDALKNAKVSHKYGWGVDSLVKESNDVVAYTAGTVLRIPMSTSIKADKHTIRLTVKRSFTRPDGTTFASEETTPELLVTIECAGYTHADATHSSTELRRFTVTHEGMKVTGDFPSVLVQHGVVRGNAGTPSLTEQGDFLNARFTVTDTYTRPDNSKYSTTERSYAERWAITESTEARGQGSYERKTWEGSTHWLTGNSTKTYTTFHRMATYQRRIATKPDGSVHVIKDWWQVNMYETQGGQRTFRD